MSLTRKLLKELELNDTAVERVIAAHVETVNALQEERDAARAQIEEVDALRREREEYRTLAEKQTQEAAQAREALEAFRAQADGERRREARRNALERALTDQGANAQAIPLLLDAIALPEESWAGDALKDAASALQPCRARYGALFSVKTPIPVTRVSPPVNAGGALTRADVQRMSAHDINRSWSAVQKALRT